MSLSRRPAVIATILLALSLALIGPLGGALAQGPTEGAHEHAIANALDWLRAQQAADGSFGGSVGNTIEVAVAAVAGGQQPASWRTAGGQTMQAYFAAQAGQYAAEAGTTGKLVTALAALGLDPRDVGGIDLVTQLRSYDDGQGAYAASALAQAWAMIGLSAAGAPIRQGAAPALIAYQQADGGWEGGPGWGTDSNTTALVAQALVAAGAPTTDPAMARAREYLTSQLAPAGGFVYSSQWGDAPDANSTAYGMQGLLALGQNATSADWTRGGRTPVDALLAFQIEGGAFEWQAGEGANLLATAQAVPALARVTYPLSPAMPDPMALTDGEAVAGTVVGRRAGVQVLYRLAHPGGGRVVTIEVSTPAAHPLILAGFGFNVYDQAGRRVGDGAVASTTPLQVLRFGGSAASPAEWTVQVYNYIEGAPLAYSITATGLGVSEQPAPTVAPAAMPPAPETPSADRPQPESWLAGQVQGMLTGSRAGAFDRYPLQVAGGEDVVVRLRFAPDDPAIGSGLGFTVYAPSGRAVPGAATGVPGERVARLAGAAAGEYLVQVHNYLPGVSMSYTLSR